MKKLKLFPKIFLYTLSILMLILFIAHGLLYYLLPTFYLDKKEEEVSNRATEIVQKMEVLNEEDALSYLSEYTIQHNVNVTLQTENQARRFQGFTPLDIYLEPTLPVEEDTKTMEYEFLDQETPQIIIEKRDFQFANQVDASIFLILNIQPIDEAKQIILKVFPYSLFVSFLIALISAYIFSSTLSRPIKQLAKVTERMQFLEKEQYFEVTTEDEIGRLGENINTLYDTLWHTIYSLETKVEEVSQAERQKIEFLWAASHELKTPLTSLSIILENMKHNIGKYADHDYYLGEAEKKVQESTAIVQNILYTTKLQTLPNLEDKHPSNLNQIILETLSTYDILAKAKQLRMHIDLTENVSIKMKPEALEKVCSNIIANAIQHTEEGKNVWISLNKNELIIENESPPLSELELQKIFEPFYRPDFSRNKKDGGTGLGLYIVKDILTYANIPFTLENGNKGVKFSLILKHVDD